MTAGRINQVREQTNKFSLSPTTGRQAGKAGKTATQLRCTAACLPACLPGWDYANRTDHSRTTTRWQTGGGTCLQSQSTDNVPIVNRHSVHIACRSNRASFPTHTTAKVSARRASETCTILPSCGTVPKPPGHDAEFRRLDTTYPSRLECVQTSLSASSSIRVMGWSSSNFYGQLTPDTLKCSVGQYAI